MRTHRSPFAFPAFRISLGLGFCLAVAGCGSAPEPALSSVPKASAPLRAPLEPSGVGFEDQWARTAPSDGFFYGAFDGAQALEALERCFPPKVRALAHDRVAPGLATWLRGLRQKAKAASLFPRGAALVLDGSLSAQLPEHAPLDFWLATQDHPVLAEALEGLAKDEPNLPLFHGVRGGTRWITSREAWKTPRSSQKPWFDAARSKVSRAASSFAVVDLGRYLEGPLGARTRVRSPAEAKALESWKDSGGIWILEGRLLEDVYRLDLWAELRQGSELRTRFQKLVDGGGPLAAPQYLPGIGLIHLGASLDWTEFFRETGGQSPSYPKALGAPALETPSGDPFHMAQGFARQARDFLKDAVQVWAGPEVAWTSTWDTGAPELGMLLGQHSPRKTIKRIQEFRRSETGKRLTFVDRSAHGVQYRYTRLDGVDPKTAEPSYGFLHGFLGMTSTRALFERLADPGAPKLDESVGFSGLLARLGPDLRAYLDLSPALFTRFPVPDSARQSLEDFSARVDRVSLGFGMLPEGRIQATGLVRFLPFEREAPRQLEFPPSPEGRAP